MLDKSDVSVFSRIDWRLEKWCLYR